MKKVIFVFCILALFTACKKDKTIGGNSSTKQIPTLKKDTTFSNRTLTVPTIAFDTILGSWIQDVKDAQGMTAIGAKISFVYAGAFRPSEDLQNIYFVVKDAGSIVFTSTALPTVNDAVNSFTQSSFLSFTQAKSYVIELHAKVLNSATDNAGADDRCTTTFDLIYQSDGDSTNKTLSAAGQTITFSGNPVIPTSNLQTMVDISTPPNDTITGSQEVELLRTKIISIGGTSIINELKFIVSDLNASLSVSTLKVYDGTTLIDSALVSGQSAVIPLNVNSPENASKTFSVKAVIGNVGVNASGSSLKVTLDNVSYKDPSGVTKNNDTNRVSNSFVLLKAMQTITSVPLSGNLQNGVLVDANKISISSVGGNTATKQLAYRVTLTDNATHIDTLSFKNLCFKIGGTLVNAKFTNSAGQIIDSVGPGDGIVRVTFSVSGFHEYINSVGSPVDYVLGGRFTGFNHQAQDGDVGSVELLMNDNPTNYRIVNSGVAPNNISAKLFDSQAGNSGAVVQNYIWSDISAGASHSFAFGSGSPDAKNASIGITLNTNPQVWSRRR